MPSCVVSQLRTLYPNPKDIAYILAICGFNRLTCIIKIKLMKGKAPRKHILIFDFLSFC